MRDENGRIASITLFSFQSLGSQAKKVLKIYSKSSSRVFVELEIEL
jgi:hypothetical protein